MLRRGKRGLSSRLSLQHLREARSHFRFEGSVFLDMPLLCSLWRKSDISPSEQRRNFLNPRGLPEKHLSQTGPPLWLPPNSSGKNSQVLWVMLSQHGMGLIRFGSSL